MTAILRMKKQKAYREEQTVKILAEYNAASTEYDRAHDFIDSANRRLEKAKQRWAAAREAKMEMDRCGIQPATIKRRKSK